GLVATHAARESSRDDGGTERHALWVTPARAHGKLARDHADPGDARRQPGAVSLIGNASRLRWELPEPNGRGRLGNGPLSDKHPPRTAIREQITGKQRLISGARRALAARSLARVHARE